MMLPVTRPAAHGGARQRAQAVRGGLVSARSEIEALFERIARANPGLNCFTRLLPERALAAAARIDAMVAAGHDPGPLAGVPFGVKDNYDVAGHVTLAGSIVNRTRPPAAEDALLARRLEAAGAILVGVQNMDELAYGFTTENAHYGPTRNPLDRARSAGGSSGGSAAAVAAGLCDLALGTDTNGSIRVPASFCGIFGLKPTFGRLPRTGTFPFVHDLDHLGLFARDVGDLAMAYDTVQGHDEGDAACAPHAVEPCLPALAQEGERPLRVAVLAGWFDDLADDQGRAAVAVAAAALGAQTRLSLRGAARARAAAFVLTSASGGNLHRADLHARAGDFDPATRSRLLAGLLLPADAILQAQRCRAEFREEVLAVFADHDILLAPATPCTAPLLGQETIRVGGRDVPSRPNIGLLTQPISCVGLPVVAVPVRNGTLPIAVQVIAPPWREDLALRAAALLERAGVARGHGDADADQ